MTFLGRFLAPVVGCLCALAPAAVAQVSPITGQDAPSAVCFAEGTDPDYVSRITTTAGRLKLQCWLRTISE